MTAREAMRAIVAERARIEPEPPEVQGCGCKWCANRHPYGCPYQADQSQIDAVMATVSE